MKSGKRIHACKVMGVKYSEDDVCPRELGLQIEKEYMRVRDVMKS